MSHHISVSHETVSRKQQLDQGNIQKVKGIFVNMQSQRSGRPLLPELLSGCITWPYGFQQHRRAKDASMLHLQRYASLGLARDIAT